MSCRCMTIAGAVAHFYFARGNREKMPRSPLWSSLFITLVYHLGTLAIGSFILALLIFVRMILVFIQRRTTWLQRGRIGNSWLKYIFSCLTFLLWIIEKIVKFINRYTSGAVISGILLVIQQVAIFTQGCAGHGYLSMGSQHRSPVARNDFKSLHEYCAFWDASVGML